MNLKKSAGIIKTLQTFLLVFCSLTSVSSTAQEGNLENISNAFSEYNTLFREVAYCHLNKSTFVKGEMLGFSGYVFEKDTKVPSNTTKNLYCVITDNEDKIIKSKLVKVTDGFTHNVFEIDSLFTSGNYTFKAYTNWMKNFEEPNAFVESFRVIDPEVESTDKITVIENTLDAQFLPEGGHFVDAVRTNVGVIIRNAKGFGVSNIEGNIYDANNNLITSFKTNHLGIGRFQLIPSLNEQYVVKINHFNKAFEYVIDDIKAKGIAININNVNNDLAIELKTNERTLRGIKGRPFKLTIHNGKQLKGLPVVFEAINLVRRVEVEDLSPGINIITLFDENNQAVLERMFFNYQGIKLVNSGKAIHTKVRDSTRISLPLTAFANGLVENLNISISILPEKTKSYYRHHNIISDTYLQPYVQGYVENAAYYFTDVNRKKKYELDNLLLTQGWSSYNWGQIFKNNVNDSHAFEDGIVLRANQNNKRQKDFMLYPLKSNEGMEISLPEDKNSFIVSELYPEEGERLGVATLNKKGKASKPNLYLQFFPSSIPDYYTQVKTLPTRQFAKIQTLTDSPFRISDLRETQMLDEVVVSTSAREIEIRKLKESAFYDVDIFDEAKRRMMLTFANYINVYVPEFFATEQFGNFTLTRRMPTSLVNGFQTPAVFLDDMLINDLNFFYGFYMDIVDYVTINDNGIGEGFIGTNGVIRIYTSRDFINEKQNSSFRSFKFPLAFSKVKKFYVPKYDVYNDAFFEQYGVMGWIPDGQIDARGNLNFTVYNPANINMKLFIEGVTDKGDFISEVKVLDVNND
ncbi:hypothetical protein LVD13_07370 [Flavobacteriaceae bacterium D16]|nr:hypothetical protein [Flavobacteriaceae bacterium D16]